MGFCAGLEGDEVHGANTGDVRLSFWSNMHCCPFFCSIIRPRGPEMDASRRRSDSFTTTRDVRPCSTWTCRPTVGWAAITHAAHRRRIAARCVMVSASASKPRLEFPGFSGHTLASRFSRRSDAEVQAPDPGEVSLGYEFIKGHRDRYSVQMMCRVLEVAVSGYYEWLKQPISNHAQEDARLLQRRRSVALDDAIAIGTARRSPTPQSGSGSAWC
jgi:hypothetical protein